MERPFEFKERPFSNIADITDKKDFWKLAVRVKDKWTAVKDGKEHLEMVIVDAKGNDIQVIIPTGYKATYDKILEENNTYTLSNFQVVSNNLVFKASEHKFLLKWTGGTTADDINVHDVPKSDTKFKPFAEIISGKWKPDILVNVIGVVQEIGYCQLNQGTGKKLQVNFTMKDLSDISINCTLWEEYAAQFIKYNSERKEGGSVIVMLKYAKIKEEAGRFPLSVSNTYNFTKLYINEDIHEINLFKGSLPQQEQNQSQSQLLCTQSYGSSQLSSEADLLSNNLILPLSNIIQLDQISYCVTVATIEKVNSTKHGWYFLACHKCPKIARGEKPPYTCDDGHNTETEIVRYKLEVDVSYEGERTTFVIWDREVTQLLEITAAQLRSNMIQAGITNRFEYPMIMDTLAGKTMVAKVKWQPKWKTCSVVSLKVGTAFVDQVKNKFPQHQHAPQDDNVGPNAMIQDINVESDDVAISVCAASATSEFDPDLSLSQMQTPSSKLQNVKHMDSLSQLTPAAITPLAQTTPAKIGSSATPIQSINLDEITPAKNSSSKRVKLIKQEKK